MLSYGTCSFTFSRLENAIDLLIELFCKKFYPSHNQTITLATKKLFCIDTDTCRLILVGANNNEIDTEIQRDVLVLGNKCPPNEVDSPGVSTLW